MIGSTCVSIVRNKARRLYITYKSTDLATDYSLRNPQSGWQISVTSRMGSGLRVLEAIRYDVHFTKRKAVRTKVKYAAIIYIYI